jgi:hypothetical protein
VAIDSVISEKLEDPIQGQSVDGSRSVCELVDPKTQATTRIDAALIYKSFGWIYSWSSSATGAHHGGSTSMAYLQNHPDDDVVLVAR